MPDAPELLATAEGQLIKPIGEFLDEFRRGSLRDDMSRKLHQLLGEVIAVEKAGTITLTLKVKPEADQQVSITGAVTSKLPAPASPAAHFYVDQHGNPTRHDPYQQRMFTDKGDKE